MRGSPPGRGGGGGFFGGARADARLAAGLRTAAAIYRTRTADAAAKAKSLAASPDLAEALRTHDKGAEQAFMQRAAEQPPGQRVELYDNAGTLIAGAGPLNSVAFARVGLTEAGQPVGSLRTSVITADQYVDEVKS